MRRRWAVSGSRAVSVSRTSSSGVGLPSHETSQSPPPPPLSALVPVAAADGSSPSNVVHSTSRILVPSLALPVSNSKRDRARPDEGEVGVSTVVRCSPATAVFIVVVMVRATHVGVLEARPVRPVALGRGDVRVWSRSRAGGRRV